MSSSHSVDINSIKINKCNNPKFIKVQEMSYLQDNILKTWEVALTHDSVSILIINKKEDKFVFVKQFRPPVFLNNSDGFTYELCAGIADKDTSLKQIAKEEILEECGYDVLLNDIITINSFFSAVGFAGAKQTLFFAFVDSGMKVSTGGGIGNEKIEIIECDINKAYEFLSSVSTTPTTFYAIMEYFRRYKQ